MAFPASPPASHARVGPADADNPLAPYLAMRAQQALFEIQPHFSGPVTGYDEILDSAGHVRPAWQEVADCIRDRGRDGLDRLRAVVRSLVDNDGITYVQTERHGPAGGDGGTAPGPWQLDALPLVISASDWNDLEAGLVQRSRLLDAVLTDLYGEQRLITGGVLPPQLLFSHPGYVRAARGIEIPGRHQLFLHGCDVSRDPGGGFTVNADWTQAPSGAGYALADRRVIAHAVPDLYEQIGPRPASPWAQALRLALVDAAPEAAEEPRVVVLSPGIHSETAFDQAYLAGVLGVPLVESADLVVRDGTVWMRSMGTLKRVDVVLRRVDAEYADPLDLRPDSRLGVVGLVEALRRGTVTVVNTLGSGILESPGVLRFLPQLTEKLVGEVPLLPTAPLYWGGIDVERSHLLAHLSSLLIRPVTGGHPIVGPELSAARREALAARIAATPWQWVGQEMPQFSSAPSDFLPGGLSSSSVGMRLFTVSQRGGYAPMIGGLGYLLAPGAAAFRLETVAAKDVWIRTPSRVTAEKIVPTTPAELTGSETARVPVAAISSPTQEISSPRVLSDLFWIGRYAERAEHMARLLTVTRERYHEYRYRRTTDGSECVPVLLTALGMVTGTDTGAGGDHAELVATAPTTLWSLTADRLRPGSLAQSVERLGLSARAVRDQMSNDTWMVLAAVERALLYGPDTPPDSQAEGDAYLASTGSLTLAGMLALSGVVAESMVRDIGWTMMDIGKRIERGLALTALVRATLTTERTPGAEQTITESTLVACESLVIYRRRNPGTVSVAEVAELLLFDAGNPRSLVYQLERLRAHLKALPGSTGSSRPERMVDEIAARLRRVEPADLEEVGDDGTRPELDALLGAIHADLRELATVITATHLSLPGDMQPLWGPHERRVLP
ncbi:putative circularly permuted ATP-grasp superfamily protein/putative alpha-E superfamily protein [Mycolicibacterium iranicum]|uniref:Putative circularly permuted ATP-grasp superfamily protein/putative alpha-E superfamily protein n=1 Tax=Mycolicibacterium iranicum TaxID=912594 RepID=A0A839Q6A5_MYCIR|nr:circularly permuted type 2 ATP-grasp protein [Mycolicibacterium iranicum]MBB2990414.1 putative circularly permuted ATP-grasp superfamily protein/putative alpha-E superfamily protein [Mycolicibacterium iranicum]